MECESCLFCFSVWCFGFIYNQVALWYNAGVLFVIFFLWVLGYKHKEFIVVNNEYFSLEYYFFDTLVIEDKNKFDHLLFAKGGVYGNEEIKHCIFLFLNDVGN